MTSEQVDVFAISDRLVDDFCQISPFQATLAGIPGFDDRWDDFSPEGIQAKANMLEDYRRQFAALPEEGDRWERLALRIGRDFIDEQLDEIRHDDPLRDLNTVASPVQHIRQMFDVMDVSTVHGWENIASRLETLDAALAGYRQTLERGRAKGLMAARRQVLAVARESNVYAGVDSCLAGLVEQLGALAGVPPSLVKRIEDGARQARTAFGDFADFLEQEYVVDAPPEDAVGATRYLRNARRFLGIEIDPAETYRWGWEEVATLRERMVEAARLIDPDLSLEEVVALVKTDPARCAPNPEVFVRIMHERQQIALAELDGTHFDIPAPIKTIDVRVAPPGGALGAYYVQASEDFGRPGTVWYALSGHGPLPLWDEVSTAYHEGFPGHHLQSGIQLSLADRLSRLHRVLVWYPGYGEGWALYTELLMDELGYLEEPEYVLGMLAAGMLRACRVVIDIGSHLGYPIPEDAIFHAGEEWDFAVAREMLADLAFLKLEYAESEVNRYLGWPGQAISYKVGEQVILGLRDELRRRQGDTFDLKGFHARVLGSGPVGLAHLRDLVLGE